MSIIPNMHSFFYDFEDDQLSSYYTFPIYCDVENKVVLIWGDDDFICNITSKNQIQR
jgi:hypothetical protein